MSCRAQRAMAPRPLKSLFRRDARWNFWCSRSVLRGFGGTHLFIRQFLHQDGRDNHCSISSFISASFLCFPPDSIDSTRPA